MNVLVNSREDFICLYKEMESHDAHESWTLERWFEEFDRLDEQFKEGEESEPTFPVLFHNVDLTWENQSQDWYFDANGNHELDNDIVVYYQKSVHITHDIPW